MAEPYLDDDNNRRKRTIFLLSCLGLMCIFGTLLISCPILRESDHCYFSCAPFKFSSDFSRDLIHQAALSEHGNIKCHKLKANGLRPYDLIHIPVELKPENNFIDKVLKLLNPDFQPHHVVVYRGNCSVVDFVKVTKKSYGIIREMTIDEMFSDGYYDFDKVKLNLYKVWIKKKRFQKSEGTEIERRISEEKNILRKAFSNVKNNCEHFAYSVVFGVHISPQIENLACISVIRFVHSIVGLFIPLTFIEKMQPTFQVSADLVLTYSPQ